MNNREYLAVFLLLLIAHKSSGLKEEDCEVCVKTTRRFIASLSDEIKKDTDLIAKEFKNFCRSLKTKEERFCYYVGGHDQSATGILKKFTEPVSWSMPAEKICEKLKKLDSQICELSYEKQIDFKTIDLKKLKVRDLKKILGDWDETCEGCLEKSDFIKRIEELIPKYVREEL